MYLYIYIYINILEVGTLSNNFGSAELLSRIIRFALMLSLCEENPRRRKNAAMLLEPSSSKLNNLEFHQRVGPAEKVDLHSLQQEPWTGNKLN